MGILMFTYLDLSLCMYVCLSHARPSDSKPNGRILVDHFQQVSIVCPNNVVCLRTSVGFLMSDGTQQKWMLDLDGGEDQTPAPSLHASASAIAGARIVGLGDYKDGKLQQATRRKE